jgi:DNA invertase Pin-like site-specific DNA recombinase
VDVLYADKASGSSRKGRQELEQMLIDLNSGDEVITLSIDRLARSTLDLLNIVEVIKKKGASLRSLHGNWLDTREENPSGDFMLTIMADWQKWSVNRLINVLKKELKLQKRKVLSLGERLSIRKELSMLSIYTIARLYYQRNRAVDRNIQIYSV